MKKTIILSTLVLFAGAAFAETMPPTKLPATEQSNTTNQAGNGFVYPSITHLESDSTVHDVVFFYNKEMVEEYEGDIERLVNYVQAAIDVNNLAFRRQDIPLRRNIAGIVAIPSNLTFNVNGDQSERVADLRRIYFDNRYNFDYFYDASYVVALTPHLPDVVNAIGSAEVGGKFSWVSPYQKDKAERTLAHELGHNDGFSHTKEEYDEMTSYLKSLRMSEYSNGTSCGTFSSIMKGGSGDRDEGFFSSPLVKNAQNTDCGDYHEADSARAYLEAIAYNIPNRIAPFANNKPARQATGTATLSVVSNVVAEGQPIVIDINWSGAELGDSVQVLTRKGVAGITDFKSSLKSVYFDGTNTTSQIEIMTLDDSEFELDESMEIALVFPHGVSISGEGLQEVTITSDDQGNAGVISFTSNAESLGEGESRTLTLQRTGGSDGEFTVNVKTESGTASDNDFNPIDRSFTFANGETSKTLTVTARNDSEQEGDESFIVKVTSDSNITGGNDTVTVTIAAGTPPSSGNASEGSSSGGSTGMFSILGLMLLMVARKFSVK